MIECNICGWAGEAFNPLWENVNVICPGCGSYERHRALSSYLPKAGILAWAGRALEVGNGPTCALKLYLEGRGWEYVSLDVRPECGGVRGDVTWMPFADDSFDLIVCLHVLEHVGDDFKALSEIFRVLNKTGVAIIQVPYDDRRFGTVENDIAPNGSYGPQCYEQHKRNYGLDVIERLRHFRVRVTEVHPLLSLPADEARRHAFEKNFGTYFFCHKSARGDDYPGSLERDILPLKRRWLNELRAYEIFRAREGRGGSSEDWLRAEAEINRMTDEEVTRLNVFAPFSTPPGGENNTG